MNLSSTIRLPFLLLVLRFAVGVLSVAVCTSSSQAWSGKYLESGTMIEIESGTLVRAGEDIEIYDYHRDAYIDVEVEDVRYMGDDVEIDIYEFKTGRRRVLEME